MLISFKKRFSPAILLGTKVFTLRKRRKVRPKIGEIMHMYSGLRTQHSYLICNNEKLISIQNVRLTIRKIPLTWSFDVNIWVDGRKLVNWELEGFAKFDGFGSLEEWAEYWLTDEKGKRKTRTGALMEMYHWTDLRY